MLQSNLQLLKIFSKIIKLNTRQILLIKKNKLNPEFNKFKNWDSLNHMKLILEIERTFKLKINNKNFTDFFNYKSIKKIIETNKFK